MADAEREAIWQRKRERQEETARAIAEALCAWLLRRGTEPTIVQRVLAEQAQCLVDAAKAPDDPEHSRDVMTRRRRSAAQRDHAGGESLK